jgi:hypothetical protein
MRLAAEAGLRLVVPPVALCGDNAAMIAWAGIERLSLGLVDDITAPARARWPLDSRAEGAAEPLERHGGRTDRRRRRRCLGHGSRQRRRPCGNKVTLWSRDAGAAARMQASRENAASLPGVALHVSVSVTAEGNDLAGAGAVLLVVPAQAIRAATAALPPLASGVPIVICAKGIERGSGTFLSDVVAETRPGAAVAVLSGPSFAADVARGLPTAVALSARDGAVAERLRPLSPGRRSGSTTAPTCAGSRSAERPRTCSPSRAAR